MAIIRSSLNEKEAVAPATASFCVYYMASIKSLML